MVTYIKNMINNILCKNINNNNIDAYNINTLFVKIYSDSHILTKLLIKYKKINQHQVVQYDLWQRTEKSAYTLSSKIYFKININFEEVIKIILKDNPQLFNNHDFKWIDSKCVFIIVNHNKLILNEIYIKLNKYLKKYNITVEKLKNRILITLNITKNVL